MSDPVSPLPVKGTNRLAIIEEIEGEDDHARSVVDD